jgi:DNA adenine methylase
MGFGGNLVRPTKSGRIEKTGFRNYSKKNRRSIPAGDWRTWPASLPVIIERMRGVIIEQRPAVEIIQEHDGPQTLHYVDPTYVRSTRSPKAAYRFEMTDADHESLSAILQACKGLVLLSGYGCPLYDRLYQDWVCHRRKANADGARARTECLWLNPAAAKWNKTLL